MRFIQDIRKIDLSCFNSLTKYPSILTYHELGDKGILNNSLIKPLPLNTTLYATEKVDGTNVRIILAKTISEELMIIGSREDLLWESKDLIGNPSMGIVDYFRSQKIHTKIWEKIYEFDDIFEPNEVIVLFGELYGHKIGDKYKQYTHSGKLNFRLFDAVVFDDIEEKLNWSRQEISNWRESGGQTFLPREKLRVIADHFGFMTVPTLLEINSNDFPVNLEETYSFLLNYKNTTVGLDVHGFSEGLVIRTNDRSYISKLRFEDYERKKRVKFCL
jgi:RNA ligase